jgi:hypothetical protein
MNRAALLKKLEAMLDEYERGSAWGTIEIEIRDGLPNYVRRMTTEKVISNSTQEKTRVRSNLERH